MANVTLQMIIYCVILVVLAVPLRSYVGKVMDGERVSLSRLLLPVENLIYRVLGIDKEEEIGWKKYSTYTTVFSVMSLTVLQIILCFQSLLPLNPQGMGKMSWHLSSNTAFSPTTNTNWQAYSGESSLSYFSQMIGLNFQSFMSAAVRIVVLFASTHGFARVKERGLGNFYTDITRTILYVLIPLSVVVSLATASQDVSQTFKQYGEVQLVESVVVEQEDDVAAEVTKGVVPLGSVASQIAIKQSRTSGGGFWSNNSAHPFKNPTSLSNLSEMISLPLIPADLCFTFGRNVKDKRQGVTVFPAMFIVPAAALAIVGRSERVDTPQVAQDGTVYTGAEGQAGGNMEGKETRFGIATSGTWAVSTTTASNGSVNSMHDSYMPFSGPVPMLPMWLEEMIFGGTGCGFYDMLGFAILTVFIAGLMVGRTPEYLYKKIESFEMKMAVLTCFATPAAILVGSGIATLPPSIHDGPNNPGAHGLSEVLYAYSSVGSNNGSTLTGFNANTPFLSVSIGLIILLVRLLPMLATLAIVGSLAIKKGVAVNPSILPTHNVMFVFPLTSMILLAGALSLFPALSLGPVAEFFRMIAQGGQ